MCKNGSRPRLPFCCVVDNPSPLPPLKGVLGVPQCAHWGGGVVRLPPPVPVGATLVVARRPAHVSDRRAGNTRPYAAAGGFSVGAAISRPPICARVGQNGRGQAPHLRCKTPSPVGAIHESPADPRPCPTGGPPRASAPTEQTNVPRRDEHCSSVCPTHAYVEQTGGDKPRPYAADGHFPASCAPNFAEGDTTILHSSLFIFHSHRHNPTAARLSSASSARFTTVNSSRKRPVWACSAWE